MAETGCVKDGQFQNLQVKSANFDIAANEFTGSVAVPDLKLMTKVGAAGNSISVEPWALFGMGSQFLAQNFGAGAVGHTLASITCPSTQVVPLARYIGASNYIKYLQDSEGTVSVASAELLLTNIGDDTLVTTLTASDALTNAWMGTNVAKCVVTISGIIDNTTTSAASINDLASAAGEQSLVLFNNLKIASGKILKLVSKSDSQFKAAGSSIYVSSTAGSSGPGGLVISGTAAGAPANSNTQTILTATGTATIFPGSFLYFNTAAATAQGMHVHGVLLTSGGTVAITFA